MGTLDMGSKKYAYYMYISSYVSIYMYVCMYVCMCVYCTMHVCTLYVHVRMYVCNCVSMYVIHSYILKYIRTYKGWEKGSNI